MKNKPERQSKLWWATVDGGVKQVTGIACTPERLRLWWCPDVGYTLTEGCHLFATETEALDRVIAELDQKMKEDGVRFRKLAERLVAIKT